MGPTTPGRRSASSPVGSGGSLPEIRTFFQPIVELATESVVGFEALSRGIDDHSEAGNSDALFNWARREGRLREFDWACRFTALHASLDVGLRPGCGMFLNVEPAALGGEIPEGFTELVSSVKQAGLAVVIEFTERALADNTGRLLNLADWARGQGWAIAVDDIGADPGSLALVPLLRPEVIKLDLRLIQARTTVDVAQIVNAVNAEAGRSGALVLAEGIETARHAALAVSMGAHLGQGWYFGRPTDRPWTETAPLPVLPGSLASDPELPDVPWALVQDSPRVRRAGRTLLEAMSRHLEQQAVASADPVMIVAAFSEADEFTPEAAERFGALAAAGAVVAVLARGIAAEPSMGVQGQHLSAHDPIRREWTIAVVTAHFAGALVARRRSTELHPDSEAQFDYVVTYDRRTVLAAAEIMVRRLQGRQDPAGPETTPATNPDTIHDGPMIEVPLGPGAIPWADPDEARRPGPAGRGQHGASSQHGAGTQRDDGTVLAQPAQPAQMAPGTAPAMAPAAAPAHPWHAAGRHADRSLPELTRVLAQSANGLSVVEVGEPGQPLAYVNAGFEVMTGYTASEVLGRNCRLLQGPQTDPAAVSALRELISAGDSGQVRLLNYRKDGSSWWNEVQLSPVTDTYGRVTHYLGVQNDVTARVVAERESARVASSDLLTGLPRRSAGLDKLNEFLTASLTGNESIALLLSSVQAPQVDREAVLRTVADELAGTVRDTDVLFYAGGSEFGLISRFKRDQAVVQAYSLAGRMHHAVAGGGSGLRLDLSVGIALSPEDGLTADPLWDGAVSALTAARRSGPQGTRYASDVGPSLVQKISEPAARPH